MKQAWSKAWKSSTQVRKQRKYAYNAPLHVAGNFLSVNLSKELRTKYNTRSVRVRKGDQVKVLRGTYKGSVGAVDKVSIKYSKVFVDGVHRTAKDGSKTFIPQNPTNLQIISVKGADKKRFANKESAKKEVKKTE